MRSFKSSSTETADALGDLNINEDEDENEYDFMDESDDADAQARRRRQQSRSKSKYMNALQDIADRTIDHITIDLDDLDTVCTPEIRAHVPGADNGASTRDHLAKREAT